MSLDDLVQSYPSNTQDKTVQEPILEKPKEKKKKFDTMKFITDLIHNQGGELLDQSLGALSAISLPGTVSPTAVLAKKAMRGRNISSEDQGKLRRKGLSSILALELGPLASIPAEGVGLGLAAKGIERGMLDPRSVALVSRLIGGATGGAASTAIARSSDGGASPAEVIQGASFGLLPDIIRSEGQRLGGLGGVEIRRELGRSAPAEDIANLTGLLKKVPKGDAADYATKEAFKTKLPRFSIGDFDLNQVANVKTFIKNKAENITERLAASRGIAKLFPVEGKSVVPSKSEISALKNIFGESFTDPLKNIMGEKTGFSSLSAWKKLLTIANIPRGLISGPDLSIPFRQGLWFMNRPKQWIPAFKEMLKSAGSEEHMLASQEAIHANENYPIWKRVGLAITHAPTEDVGNVEESAIAGHMIEKIPFAGRAYAASNRAATAFSNKIRTSLFDHLSSKLDTEGLIPQYKQISDKLDRSEELLQKLKTKTKGKFGAQYKMIEEDNKQLASLKKQYGDKLDARFKPLADYINTGSGRGSIGHFKGATHLMANAFFSPKLWASRLKLFSPYSFAYYNRLPKEVRVEAMKDLIKNASLASTVLGIAKYREHLNPGGSIHVETDLRSADIGKIKVGDTRFDILGGFSQVNRLLAQLGSPYKDDKGNLHIGQYKSSTSGVVKNMGEPGNNTMFDQILTYGTNKTSPLLSLMITLAKQKGADGKPVKLPKEIIDRMYPLYLQDYKDAAEEYGKEDPLAIGTGIASFSGLGTQTYSDNTSENVLRKAFKKAKRDGNESEMERLRKLIEEAKQRPKE